MQCSNDIFLGKFAKAMCQLCKFPTPGLLTVPPISLAQESDLIGCRVNSKVVSQIPEIGMVRITAT